MTKDGNGGKLNGSINLAIKLAAILVIIGSAWQMLRSHETRIEKVEIKAHETEMESIGVKKDIEQLDEKVGRIETEQKTQFKAILKS